MTEQKIEQKVPYMFRGSSRVYRVIGTQDEVFYGVSIEFGSNQSDTRLSLSFACLGKVPEGSPFTVRDTSKYMVSMTEHVPEGAPIIVDGQRLDKIQLIIGTGLSQFSAVKHLHSQLPAIQKWLDNTLEEAGIVPTFNNVEDILNFFYGKDKKDCTFIPLDLKSLGSYSISAPAFDYSQYGKNTLTKGSDAKKEDPSDKEDPDGTEDDL